jgi:hypothetical protein
LPLTKAKHNEGHRYLKYVRHRVGLPVVQEKLTDAALTLVQNAWNFHQLLTLANANDQRAQKQKVVRRYEVMLRTELVSL